MNLYGPVRADKNVGTGEATVTLSMKWNGTPVASTTHTLLVSDPTGGQALPVCSRLIRSLPHAERKANVADVRFTPKGTLFTAGYPSGVVQLWDPATGKELRRIDSPRGYRGSADYALVPADFGTLFVSIGGRKVIHIESDPKQPWRIEYDSKFLAWDMATGKPKPAVKGTTGFGIILGYSSPDGDRLISLELPAGTQTPLTYTTRMTDTATGRSWKLTEGQGMPAFSPDGKRVYVSVRSSGGKKGGGLLVFDREGKEQPPLIRMGTQRCSAPTVSPDGKWLVVSVSKGRKEDSDTLKVFDLATGKVVADIAGKGGVGIYGATFSPDGRFMAALDTKSNVRVFEVAKWNVVLEHELKGMRDSSSMAFSKDGRRLAVPMQEKSDQDKATDPDPLDCPQPRLYLFDLTKPMWAPEAIVCPHGWMGGLAFSADGKTLAFGSSGAVHLFDVSGPAK